MKSVAMIAGAHAAAMAALAAHPTPDDRAVVTPEGVEQAPTATPEAMLGKIEDMIAKQGFRANEPLILMVPDANDPRILALAGKLPPNMKIVSAIDISRKAASKPKPKAAPVERPRQRVNGRLVPVTQGDWDAINAADVRRAKRRAKAAQGRP